LGGPTRDHGDRRGGDGRFRWWVGAGVSPGLAAGPASSPWGGDSGGTHPGCAGAEGPWTEVGGRGRSYTGPPVSGAGALRGRHGAGALFVGRRRGKRRPWLPRADEAGAIPGGGGGGRPGNPTDHGGAKPDFGGAGGGAGTSLQAGTTTSPGLIHSGGHDSISAACVGQFENTQSPGLGVPLARRPGGSLHRRACLPGGWEQNQSFGGCGGFAIGTRHGDPGSDIPPLNQLANLIPPLSTLLLSSPSPVPPSSYQLSPTPGRGALAGPSWGRPGGYLGMRKPPGDGGTVDCCTPPRYAPPAGGAGFG